MVRSESWLRPAHWTGAFDARPLALFRIALGAVLLQDLWARVPEIDAFLTDGGMMPRAAAVGAATWSAFNVIGSPPWVALLFALGALTTLAFTVGYRTRAAAFASWLFFVSLHHRLPLIHTGGDTLADCLLLLGCCTDLSGRWAVDARRRGERAAVPALVPRLMQYLPVVLYLETARAKLLDAGAAWWNGPLIFEHLQLAGWVRPAGAWLGQHPALCALLTGATIVVELLIPLLFALPFQTGPARALAALGHLALQLGILLTLKVGVFTNVMLAATALWLQPEWLDAAGGWLRRRGAERPAARRPVQLVVPAGVAALYALAVLDPVAPTHLPRWSRPLLTWVGMDLKIGLFTSASPSMRWESSGVRADGSRTDPLRAAVPGAVGAHGFRNSLWMQLPYRMTDYAPLGRFVCARYNAAPAGRAAPLERWTLVVVSREPYPPDAPVPAETRRTRMEQRCDGEGRGALATARGPR